MDSTVKGVDIEEIMSEIRREIKEKGYKDEDILFSEIPLYSSAYGLIHSGEFEDNLGFLRANNAIAAYRPLKSNRIVGFLIIFLKKIIRKLTKFYIEPIVTDQNENNRLVTACIQDLYLDIDEIKRSIKQIQYDVDQLKSPSAYYGK